MDYNVIEIKTITTGFVVKDKTPEELDELIKDLRNSDKKINPLSINLQEVNKTYISGEHYDD